MNDTVDVAIVGAGPYGLSIAAHLRGTGVSVRQFGYPMNLWRSMMPTGMFLKSQGFASNLSDPAGTHTLQAFCAATARGYADYGRPVELDTFIRYGLWFREELVPDLEEVLVENVTAERDQFRLTLADGGVARARQVVVAAGVEHFAYLPEELAHLSPTLCTHASQHTDLSVYSGRSVLVVGAGQSALETAALLHEHGAEVSLVARRGKLAWNGQPLLPNRPLSQRIREPEAGLGSGLSTWFYSNHPEAFRHLPTSTRVFRARTALGPAGGWWLRERVEGRFPVLLNHRIGWAKESDDGVRLGVQNGASEVKELAADHLIAATGYRPDLRRLSFLPVDLRSRLRTCNGTPVVDGSYQSSVRGLYFAGPAVTPTFGPVMRFVYGSAHAAHAVSRALIGSSVRGARAAVGVGR